MCIKPLGLLYPIAKFNNNYNMSKNLIYLRKDIEQWLIDNYQQLGHPMTYQDYSINALKYHNSNECISKCCCYDENEEVLRIKIPVQKRKWFKQVIVDTMHQIWLANTFLEVIAVDRVQGKNPF